MNILWLTIDALLPLETAGRLGIYKRLEAVGKHHQVYLYYLYTEEKEYEECKKLEQFCIKVYGFRREKNIFQLLLKYLKYPYTVSTRINKELSIHLKKCINRYHIDCINVDFPQMGYYLMQLNDLNNIPIVINQHNIEWNRFKEISMSNSISNLKKIIFSIEAFKLKRFEEKLYRSISFNAITFVTGEDKSYFQKWLPDIKTNLQVIPGGGEYHILPANEKSSYNIIFVGVMSNELNPEGAIWFVKEILPIIKKSIPYVKFYIVGKDPVSELLEITDESVVVTGFVDDLDTYYELANFVVIPILHGGGVKLKLLEAIGRGKVVISTSCGVRGTDFKNNQHLFVRDTANDFAQQCIALLRNPTLGEKVRQQAIALFKEKYTWEVIGQKYLELLCKVKNSF